MSDVSTYVLIYFIYGLSFFTMGLIALQQRKFKNSDLPLLRAVISLGGFGIIHAIVEWIMMIIILNAYPMHTNKLIILNSILNPISYIFLYDFGVKLLGNDFIKKLLVRYLVILNSIIIIVIFYKITFLNEQLSVISNNLNVIVRYFIAVPATIIIAIGLYDNSKIIQKFNIKRIAYKLNALGILFLLYGILAGIIVNEGDFFPANIINIQNFRLLLGFPVELARAFIALCITIIFINIVDIFMWEADYKINKLRETELIFQERRRLGYKLHDSIIQNLFAVGLGLENLIDCEDEEEQINYLKGILNGAIEQIRDFIGNSTISKLSINDFKVKIEEMILKMQKFSGFKIIFKDSLSELTLGYLFPELLEQIYYVIQEAITNSIKHSDGNLVIIDIKSDLRGLYVVISDNGKGFCDENKDYSKSYGLLSMKERVNSINGQLLINSGDNGVEVRIEVPWEETYDR